MDSADKQTQKDIARNLKQISDNLSEQNRLLSELLKHFLRLEGK